MFTPKKRLVLRQRLFATTAAFIATMLMAMLFQNCSGSGSSTGNGGGYGGGLTYFPRVTCVSDQAASDGKQVEITVTQPSDVQSFTLTDATAEYINPNYILQVDMSAFANGHYPGLLDFIDNGVMKSFTVKCQ